MSVTPCLIVLVSTPDYSVLLISRLSIILAIIYHLLLELSAALLRILLYMDSSYSGGQVGLFVSGKNAVYAVTLVQLTTP